MSQVWKCDCPGKCGEITSIDPQAARGWRVAGVDAYCHACTIASDPAHPQSSCDAHGRRAYHCSDCGSRIDWGPVQVFQSPGASNVVYGRCVCPSRGWCVSDRAPGQAYCWDEQDPRPSVVSRARQGVRP